MQLTLKVNENGIIKNIGTFTTNTYPESEGFCSSIFKSELVSSRLIEWPVMHKSYSIKKEIVRSGPDNCLLFCFPFPINGYAFPPLPPFFMSSFFSYGTGKQVFADTAKDILSLLAFQNIQNYIKANHAWVTNSLMVNHLSVYNSPEYKDNITDLVCMSYLDYNNKTSSLRNIKAVNKEFNILNHLFPFSPEFMMELANQHNFDEMKRDIEKNGQKRWFCKFLEDKNNQPSPLVESIMDSQKEIMLETFHLRKNADPLFHLHAWDASFTQLKYGILNQPIGKSFIPKTRASNKSLSALYREKYVPILFRSGFFPKDATDIIMNYYGDIYNGTS